MSAGRDLGTALRAAWDRQARRIDALSLRERAILFLCIAAVLAALFDTLVLEPYAARARQRSAAQAQQAAELAQLREQFVAASRGGESGLLRQRLDNAQAERARLDAELRRAGSAGGGEAMPALLQRLLAQQPGLVLERLHLLDDAPVALPGSAQPGAALLAPAGAAAPARAEPSPSLPGMAWQGVELQVQGGYREMQRYLQALERALPGLRWGELRLSAAGGAEPARLQAQLFLLRVQP